MKKYLPRFVLNLVERFLNFVYDLRQRKQDKIWNERLETAIIELTGITLPIAKDDIRSKNKYEVAKAMLKPQIEFLRTDSQTFLEMRAPDKRNHFAFKCAVQALKHLKPVFSLVGVQPMQGPASKVFTMRYTIQPTEKVDQLNGLLTNASPPNRIALQIVSEAVQAVTRKLRPALHLDHIAAASKEQIITDLSDEIADVIGAEIAFDITSEILADLKDIATTHRECDLSLPESIETSYSNKLMTLVFTINQVAGEIAKLTMRGHGNFIVTSAVTVATLQSISKSAFAPVPRGTFTYGNLTLMGKLHGTIDVWCNTSSTSNDILIGYKGDNGETDAGYFYCPYVLMMTAGVVIDPETLQPVMPLMTRYGKYLLGASETSPVACGSYYGVIKVTGLDLVDSLGDIA